MASSYQLNTYFTDARDPRWKDSTFSRKHDGFPFRAPIPKPTYQIPPSLDFTVPSSPSSPSSSSTPNPRDDESSGERLMSAIKDRRSDAIVQLLQADPSLQPHTPCIWASPATTFLGWAIHQSNPQAAQLLLSRVPDPPAYDLSQAMLLPGRSEPVFPGGVLHAAVFTGQEDLVRFLLGRVGVSLAAVDPQGRTALDLAVERGWLEIVKILAQQTPDFFSPISSSSSSSSDQEQQQQQPSQGISLFSRAMERARAHGRLHIALWLREYDMQQSVEQLMQGGDFSVFGESTNLALLFAHAHLGTPNVRAPSAPGQSATGSAHWLPPLSSEDLPLYQQIAHCLHGQSAQQLYFGEAVLTVRSGSGLKACDLNGKSDPYVVVSLARRVVEGAAPVEVAKTPVAHKTLSPAWQHAQKVDALYPGDVLVFTVWDKDLIGRDFMGEARLEMPHNLGLLGEGEISLRLRGREGHGDKDITGELVVSLSVQFASSFVHSGSSFHEPSVAVPQGKILVDKPRLVYYLQYFDHILTANMFDCPPLRDHFVDAPQNPT